MKVVSLVDFVGDVKNDLDGFLNAYYEKHKEDPDGYPFTLDADDAGLWGEMFNIYCTTGEV